MTIACTSIDKRPVYTVIFKNDLLAQFEPMTKVYSVAQFFIEILKLPDLMVYKNFTNQLTARITPTDYVKLFASILSRVSIIDMRDVLVILDEYTIINKTLLFILLVVFKHYKIGCILSGDKNQLQTIGDSKNTRATESYELAQLFADKTFNFTKNERCVCPKYNEMIKLVSRYSTDKKLDDFGYAMVTAALFENMNGVAQFSDTFISSTHRSLAITQHTMTIDPNEDIKTSFYMWDNTKKVGKTIIRILDKNGVVIPAIQMPSVVSEYAQWATRMHNNTDSRNLNKNTIFPFKFLPYIPLKVGCYYYVHHYSDSCIGELINIDLDNKILTLRMQQTKSIVRVVQSSQYEGVIFEEHRFWLKNVQGFEEAFNGNSRKIFNYPIYPAKFMTIHRAQGCTISDRINMDLTASNYQALYVAMSRVNDKSQIINVKIPKQLAHTLSVIVNFPQYCNVGVELTGKDIESKLKSNYLLYTPKRDWITHYANLVQRFLNEVDNRGEIRKEILCGLNARCMSEIIAITEPQESAQQEELEIENSQLLFSHILKYLNYYKCLSNWPDRDRLYWIHEFLRLMPEFKSEMFDTTTNYTTLESHNMIRQCTNLFSIPLSESSLNSLKNQTSISSEKTEQTIESGDFGYVQAQTLFQKYLHQRLVAKEPITIAWLEEQLINCNRRTAPTIKEEPFNHPWRRTRISNVICEVPAIKRRRLIKKL